MTKKELIKALEPYSDDQVIVGKMEDGGWDNIDEIKVEDGMICIKFGGGSPFTDEHDDVEEVIVEKYEDLPHLHLITQDDQPIGSARLCCEECGHAKWHFNKVKHGSGYVENRNNYTKEYAEEHGYVRCRDIKKN
jgi:hypothetical protein